MSDLHGYPRVRCERCDKVCHATQEEAETVAQYLTARDGKPRGAYFKPSCGHWHLTTSDLKRAEKNRAYFSQPKMILRDYQQAAVDHLYEYFNKNVGNPIIAMPTGTGKALVIGAFIRSAVQQYPRTRVLMLTHVKELIEQNFKHLLKLWPTAPAGIYSAGVGRRDSNCPVTFAGIQSVFRKPELFGHIDLVIIDECHLVSPKSTTMYRNFLDALKAVNPFLKVIGLTATAFRLGQGMLTDDDALFTDVAFDLTSRESFNWLIAQGWLSQPVPKKTTSELDVSNVRIQGGEFVLEELQQHVDKASVTIAALKETVELAADRKHWLIFASGIEHAEHIKEFLETQFNIPAGVVHSRMDDDRDQVIQDFKSGKIRALVNNNILTTGFDYPDIDCIVMLRPTASPVLWVQMLGRGTRPIYAPGFDLTTADGRLKAIRSGPKPNCLVLDFAGNTRRLGPINDPVLPRKRGKGPPGLAPVRLCDVCGCYSHAAARFCENPECGVEFPRQVKIQTAASTEALIAGVLPQVETFQVDFVLYKLHRKEGRPDSMRVDYHCGLRRFSEYICLDHGGYAGHLARQWWELRSQWGVPPSVHDGMSAVNYIKEPKRIRVIMKKQHPEICGYEFD